MVLLSHLANILLEFLQSLEPWDNSRTPDAQAPTEIWLLSLDMSGPQVQSVQPLVKVESTLESLGDTMAAVWAARRTSEVPQISGSHGNLAPSGQTCPCLLWLVLDTVHTKKASTGWATHWAWSGSLCFSKPWLPSCERWSVKSASLVVRMKWGNYIHWLIPCVVFSASSTSQQWWWTTRCLQMSRPEGM